MNEIQSIYNKSILGVTYDVSIVQWLYIIVFNSLLNLLPGKPIKQRNEGFNNYRNLYVEFTQMSKRKSCYTGFRITVTI